MYVAQIEYSGMDALAALGIVLPITLIIQAFANLIGPRRRTARGN